MVDRKPAAPLALAIAAALVAGCAANPHTATRSFETPPSGIVPLGTAINHANALRDDYRNKIVAEAERTQGIGAGLIGLGGLLLGAAAGNAHKDALVFGAIGGGTAYTLANWNTDRGRNRAYEQGMTALECSVKAVMPLVISPGGRRSIAGEANSLRKAIDAVNLGISAVEGLLDTSGDIDAKLAAAARKDLDTARKLRLEAHEVAVRVQGLELDIGRVGNQLANAVKTIDTLVIKANEHTIASLESAWKDVVKNLAASADAFVPSAGLAGVFAARMGPPPAPAFQKESATPKQLAEDKLREALQRLKAAALQLETQADGIGKLVSGINPSGVQQRLDGCGIVTAPGLAFEPATLLFMEKKADEQQVTVISGTKPFFPKITSSASGLTIKPMDRGDSSFWIAATDKVAPGDYTVSVSDSAQSPRARTLIVKVQAAPKDEKPEDPRPGDKKPGAAAPAGYGVAKSRADIELVQRALCAKVDGKPGPNTELAIEIYQSEAGGTPDGALTAVQLGELKKAAGDCPKDRLNSFERNFDAGSLDALAKKLGAASDGTISAALRAKLVGLKLSDAFANAPGNAIAMKAKAKGQLTQRLYNEIK